ncbi:MAG: alpha/beta hydrolase [Saprospiraceae bacterium]|nr:alpha/beta hydrolase [Saprospiraceae bacterium]
MKGLIIFILLPILAISQPPSNRYNAELFTVSEINDIQFSTGVPQPNEGGGFYEWITGYPLNVEEYNTSPVDLKMDIFQPSGDTLQKRPLVIVCFGGGFLSGSKDHWSIRLICQNLAKRGYVAAAIDYRLGMNIFDSDLANRAVYRGLQDARSAVRFFRADAANSNTYKIDPDHIFIGGHSSGAFMALHNAYLDKETERPLSTYEWIQDGEVVPDQDCIDCVGDNVGYSGHANAIFSLAGALGFTSFMESASDPKVVMFHSTDDGTVPYDSGQPFSSILWLVIGSDLPDVYGSLPISTQADQLGLSYDFSSYTNRGHDVHESSSSSLYTDIMPGISDWFFDEELKPIYDGITGNPIVCDNELIKSYSLDGGDGIYFDWQVEGGIVLSPSVFSNKVLIDWSPTAENHSIAVTPFNQMDAKGATYNLNIDIQGYDVNQFLFTSNEWSDSSNWILNHPPTACEDVFIAEVVAPTDIFISDQTEINSLELGSNTTLINNSDFLIHQKTSLALYPALHVYGNIINNETLTIHNDGMTDEVSLEASSTILNNGEVKVKD